MNISVTIGKAVRTRGSVALSACALLASSFVHAETKPTKPTEPETAGGAPIVRLITDDQYRNTIADIFGGDIKIPVKLPSLRRVDGMATIGAGSAVVPPSVLSVFTSAGRSIAAQVVDKRHRDALVPCAPQDIHSADPQCSRSFFQEVGPLMFRRPLTPTELDGYASMAEYAATELKDFYAGLAYSLAGMMVAPEFIYFVERSEPDPAQPGQLRLDGPSKAMRLSLLLWNSPPDAELRRAAEAGELHTEAGLARQVDRLVASKKLERGVAAFFDDMLHISSSFSDASKDPLIYPAFTQQVMADAREQTFRIIVDHLVRREADYRDLFTTKHVFLSQSLAPLYRVPVPAAGSNDWVAYDLPDNDPRAGLLTQVGFLAVNSPPGRSSPTVRGKALRETFMCQKVPAPPPNVDFSAVNTPNPNIRTARERLEIHRTNPVCAGCHKITDPIGLALENFDGAGVFRAEEKGAPIDASGSVNGVDFKDAKQMQAALKDDPAVMSCVVQRLYQYGLVRSVGADDKPVLGYFKEQFTTAGGRFTALLRQFGTSKALYRVSDQTNADAATTARAD